jgi:hypothetical protein
MAESTNCEFATDSFDSLKRENPACRARRRHSPRLLSAWPVEPRQVATVPVSPSQPPEDATVEFGHEAPSAIDALFRNWTLGSCGTITAADIDIVFPALSLA